jgi:hypothetical protein
VYTSKASKTYLQDHDGEAQSSIGDAEGPASVYVQSTAPKSTASCNTSMFHASKPDAATNTSLQRPPTAASEGAYTGVVESVAAPCVRIFWDADTIPFYKPVYGAILKKICCSRVCSPYPEKTEELLLCFL